MIRTTPLWRYATVLGVASLALAACGGSSTSTTTSSSSETSASAGAVAQGDGNLVLGTLLPQTGSLAFLGPPEFAGVKLAVKDMNDAGGVLGKPVQEIDSDSGDTSTDIASQSVDRLLSQKADAIIGAASSSVSLTVIDKITQNGVVMMSPANTSDAFTTYNDKGLYFRTAPPDVLQGRVLGDLILSDGNATVGILALQDSYGTGLASNVKKAVEGGGGQVVAEKIYDPKAANFAADVGEVLAAKPDAIALISFDEATKIVPELVKQGFPMDKVYWCDGNLSNSYTFPAGTLNGGKGTLPGVVADDSFRNRLLEVDPSLKDFSYAPESYDAAVLIGLAAEAAKNDSGTAIASKLEEVSKGGEKCTTFADCKKLLDAGTDIDYDGVSGPIEFNAAGDPTEATIGIYQYGPDNKYKFLEAKSGKI
jgi:branched-chain amino acid transport system substrate-binding protein